MSDSSDRIHEPSPIRLAQAREEGRVARSAELSRALILCVMLAAIFVLAGTFQQLAGERIRQSIQKVSIKLTDMDAAATTQEWLALFAPVMFFFGSVTCIGLLVWHFQSPLNFRVSKVSPDLGRLSLGRSLGQMFSWSSLARTLTLLAAFIGCATAVCLIVFSQSGRVATIASLDLKQGLKTADSFLRNMLVATGVILLVLGFADYLRERFKLAAQLKMTDQERRDEARDLEMNPQLRRRMFN